jgi:hypothetical protein
MELVSVLNLLWARRIAVGLGVLVAIGAGVVAKPTRRSATGSAVTAALLVDATKSALVTVSPAQDVGAVADPLPLRAAFLAEVMATDQFQKLLSNQAHVRADQLDVVPPSSSTAPTDSLITQKAATLAANAPGPYVLHLVADEQTPLISIETEAPDTAGAVRLAAASMNILKSSLASQQAGGGPPVVVRTVASPTKVALVSRAPHRAVAVVVSIVVFALWCGGIVLVCAITRKTREPLPG